MGFIRRIFCKHRWHFEGKEYVACHKCGKILNDPEFNRRLQSDFFDKVELDNPKISDWFKIFLRRHY